MTCPPGATRPARAGRSFVGRPQDGRIPHVARPPILFALLVAISMAWPAQARADHALEFYPSHYPHEVRIELGENFVNPDVKMSRCRARS